MATITVLVELDDTAPMKTFAALQALPGVINIHMSTARSPAELRRFLRAGETPSASATASVPAPASAAATLASDLTARQLLLRFIAKNKGARFSDCRDHLDHYGRDGKSAGAVLNTMVNKTGEARRLTEGGYTLTAAGKRAVAEVVTMNAATLMDGKTPRLEHFGNDAVVKFLQARGGSAGMPDIFVLAQEYGQTNEHASAAVGRLIAKGLVSAEGKRGQRIVQLRENTAHAT